MGLVYQGRAFTRPSLPPSFVVFQVKPGTMMDIVTNIHSKRKTETMPRYPPPPPSLPPSLPPFPPPAHVPHPPSLPPSVSPFHAPGERSYGADAYSLLTRRPEMTYARIPTLLGRHDEHPSVELLEEAYFPTKVRRAAAPVYGAPFLPPSLSPSLSFHLPPPSPPSSLLSAPIMLFSTYTRPFTPPSLPPSLALPP